MAKIQYTVDRQDPWNAITHESHDSVPAGSTTYTAWGDQVPPDDWTREDSRYIARGSVQHMSPYLHSSEKGQEWNAQRVKEGLHPKLFFENPSVIESLNADPKMTHTVPTILGLMVNDNKGNLTHDYSLSKYSSPLAQKGIELGVISPNPENPEAEQRNRVRMRELVDYQEDDGDETTISDDRVRDARSTVRGILRPKKAAPEAPAVPQHLSTQFHPQLPGLEG